jgi:TonB-dependent starch-binding outer membrane protein SusC
MMKFYLSLKRYFMFLLLFVTSTMALSQSKTITGTVKSSDDNSPLPGVNVLEKGTSNGTVTNSDGNFSLATGAQATLVFTFIGYGAQEISVANQSVVDVTMVPEVTQLSDVVVVGYGTVQKKDLTGAVASVTSRDFNAGINPNPLQAIQGKVAGLNITQPSGDPNQAPTVRLRGYTSLLGGSDPLYVVDGVIGVPINSISPADIEQMDVLKDASASAIYGSRAANGVIMITTKRGKEGKTSISFNNYVGIETISNELDLLNADQYRAQVSRIKGDASFDDTQKFPKDANGNGYSTDWMNEILQKGHTINDELAISGGTSSLSYRGSLNYTKREGIVKNTGFDRVTGRINLDQKAIDNKLNIQYNLALTTISSDLANNDIINRALLFLPTLPVYNPDGTYYEIPGSFDAFNPVAMQNNFQNDQEKKILIGGMNIHYEVVPGLTLGANGAYRYENEVNSLAYNGTILGYTSNQGNASRELKQINNKLLELTAQYKTNFGTNHNLTVLGGYSYQDNIDDGFLASNKDFIAGSYSLTGYNRLSLGRGALLQPGQGYATSNKAKTTLISFFGRATVNLSDRYNLTATLRQDGSSKFGANNKWGTFPSVAAGWIISNEGFLAGKHTLNFLKLRVGWGQTGNSEGLNPYNSLLLYDQTSTYYDGQREDFLPGYGAVQNANPNLKWEVLTQVNIGLDFEMFDGGLNGTLEVYDKKTTDMLYVYNVAPDGVNYFATTITSNVGEMSNKGIELTLGGDVIRSLDFRWNARLVGSVYKNEMVKLSNTEFGAPTIFYNAFGGRGLGGIYASQLREGHPLGEFTIPRFVGFDTNGDILMEAKDGGAPTNDASLTKLYDAGIGTPKYTVALVNGFTYKHFDLSFQLRGMFGNKIINNLRSNFALPGSILENNMLTEVADYPINYSTPRMSDLWLESASFVRLDNWQVGYNIPVKGVLQNARVYVGGNNLFVITDYKGVDPELEVKGDLAGQAPNSIGMDYSNIYPKTRTFQLGLNLTF